jgi:hypothetical protein
MNAPVIVAATLGFGRDMWSIPPDNITTSLKWLYVAYFMYQVAEALCQLSILAFYIRIMVDPKLRLAVWVLIGLVTCFGVGNTFAMIFQCMPIPFFWDGWREEMSGRCGVNVQLFGFIRGGVEILLDLAILILPLPRSCPCSVSVSSLRLSAAFDSRPLCNLLKLRTQPVCVHPSSAMILTANVMSRRRQYFRSLLVRDRIKSLYNRCLHASHA